MLLFFVAVVQSFVLVVICIALAVIHVVVQPFVLIIICIVFVLVLVIG